MLNEDYKEILQILLDNEVKFLVVGAYAMGAYGYPRATGDFDIWVEASEENSKKIYKSLAVFGAPLSGITENTFAEKEIVFQIGVAPRRIDFITHIDGVDFKTACNTKEEIEIENIKIPFLSKENLIKNKESTGREKDKLDVKYLKNNQKV
ncbi:nucleotidyltransferase [Patescibacteria group bacterium]|nr:nucleotidyltransferase [Patescibacteria group bacterium]